MDAPVRSSVERHVALVAACIALLAGSGRDGAATQEGRTHLRLRAARIVEVFDPAPVSEPSGGLRRSEMRDGNRVAFSVELSATPSCGPGANPAYLFLIDADRSAATGGRTQAVPELGIDFKIEIRCDPATRRFLSSLGEVDVRAGAGESPTIIEVVAPANVLPSEQFHWVVLAHDGARFVRLPDAGRFEAWRPLNQWLK